MISLGIMTLFPEQKKAAFEHIAQYAVDYDIKVYLFTPTVLRPHTESIQGYRYDTEEKAWTEATFSLPSFLYDRCFYGNDSLSKRAQSIVSWLKSNKEVTYLGYGLPTKFDLYEKLKQHTKLAPYLPQTVKVNQLQDILDLLAVHPKIIIKPDNGAHGFAVYEVSKQNKDILIRTTKNKTVVEKKLALDNKTTEWFNRLLQKFAFLAQPKLNNLNDKQEPYDLRLYLQKNKLGEWEQKAKAIRIGQKNGILTNVSNGASVHAYNTWVEQQEKFPSHFINRELKELVDTLTTELDQSFPPLFELGIDIILAKNHAIWILDINSKPGHKIVEKIAPSILESVHRGPLVYTSFLQEELQKQTIDQF